MAAMKLQHSAILSQIYHLPVGRGTKLGNVTNASTGVRKAARRRSSTTTHASRSVSLQGRAVPQLAKNGAPAVDRRFAKMKTSSLVRSVILGNIFCRPRLFNSGLWALEKIADSKAVFWNADRNPLLRMLIYPLIYKQLCAGRNKAEVQRTIAEIKQMGYSGVILCYSKEVMAKINADGQAVIDNADHEHTAQNVEEWKQGNLLTLSTVSPGDFIGVKLTGAGPAVSQALKDGLPTPPSVLQALHAICDQALAENKRLWIDAEQQLYHPTIDKWTIKLMRKYNRHGRVLVLTTIQSYLKSSRSTVTWYLQQAHAEGWALGIKLVRGAYISSDVRCRIHDTKPETDASYDGIAHDLLTRSGWPGFDDANKAGFPPLKLFLTGHNVESIRKASALARDLAPAGELAEPVHYGQLQGMADDIGCEMLDLAERARKEEGSGESAVAAAVVEMGLPKVYKCLTWGSVNDCLHYLVRRAVENRSAAASGIGQEGLRQMQAELRRRILGRV